MATLGEAKVKIRAVLEPLKTGLKKARSLTKTAAKGIATSAISGVKKAISGTIKTVTKAVKNLTKIAVAAFTAVGVAAIKMAADAEESENLFNVSLAGMGDAVRKWSEDISDALGLNRFEVRKFVSVFNAMLISMGLGAEEAAVMSTQLTKLAFDMASFFNLKPAEAFQKLQAGITGEIEPLKRLGVIVNETIINQRGLNTGVIEGKQKLNELQKVQLRYAEILDQTTAAQGDLARTLDSTTNVFRTIKSLMQEVLIVLGNELTPKVTELAVVFRDFIRDNQEGIKEWAKEIGAAFDKVVTIIVDFLAGLESPTVLGKVAEAGRKIGEAIGEGITTGIENKFPTLSKFLGATGAVGGALIQSSTGAIGGNPTQIEQVMILREIARNTQSQPAGSFP